MENFHFKCMQREVYILFTICMAGYQYNYENDLNVKGKQVLWTIYERFSPVVHHLAFVIIQSDSLAI